jgi:protein-tyrosine phosphatase
MIDLHCHLLPGVDDGAADLPTALTMAEQLAALGYEAICCTPHLPYSSLPTSTGQMERLRTDLASHLVEAGIPLALHLGAEHHIQDVLERLGRDELVTYPRGDTFLLEFSHSGLPARLEELLFRCQLKGKLPVLAHLERYPEVQRDPTMAAGLRERGSLILINLTSLVGAWSREADRAARALLEADLVDAATTDLHGPDEIDRVADGLAILERLVGGSGRQRLLQDGPARIAGLVRPQERST